MSELPKTPQTELSRWQQLWESIVTPSNSTYNREERKIARLANSFLFVIALFEFIGAIVRFAVLGISITEAFSGGLKLQATPFTTVRFDATVSETRVFNTPSQNSRSRLGRAYFEFAPEAVLTGTAYVGAEKYDPADPLGRLARPPRGLDHERGAEVRADPVAGPLVDERAHAISRRRTSSASRSRGFRAVRTSS